MPAELSITICMGSSCYSRGNRRNIEVIQNLLSQQPGDAQVKVVGHLCDNECLRGPNVQIGETVYHAVDSASLAQLLRHHLEQSQT